MRTGAVVSKITDTGGGVSVAYAQGGRTKVVEADFCIAALPPNILAKVPHNLGSGVQSALKVITPSSAAKIGLEYKCPHRRLAARAFTSARKAVTALHARVLAS